MSLVTPDVATLPHYTSQQIQPIEYMVASMEPQQFIGFLKGNVIKYISRADKKNKTEDLHKARVYLNWLIEYTEIQTITVKK
jgi:hypothetical protein